MKKKHRTWRKKAPHRRSRPTSELLVWLLLAALAVAADGIALAQILGFLS